MSTPNRNPTDRDLHHALGDLQRPLRRAEAAILQARDVIYEFLRNDPSARADALAWLDAHGGNVMLDPDVPERKDQT